MVKSVTELLHKEASPSTLTGSEGIGEVRPVVVGKGCLSSVNVLSAKGMWRLGWSSTGSMQEQ